MGRCSRCPSSQARLNPGNLCKKCYDQTKNIQGIDNNGLNTSFSNMSRMNTSLSSNSRMPFMQQNDTLMSGNFSQPFPTGHGSTSFSFPHPTNIGVAPQNISTDNAMNEYLEQHLQQNTNIQNHTDLVSNTPDQSNHLVRSL